MAVISVTGSDSGADQVNHAVPGEPELNYSVVPRATRHYESTLSYAAKLAADQTRVEVTFNFPQNFYYLLKSLVVNVQSDDQTLDFNANGAILYALDHWSNNPQVPVISDGVYFHTSSLKSGRLYTPRDTPRYFIDGPKGDQFIIQLSDTSSDASPAGDVIWYAEFWVFDVDQVNKWPINTAQPVFSWGQ